MEECRFLRIVFPEIGRPYGKCPFMNNGENLNDYLAIRDAILAINPDKIVAPNGDCPFFNQSVDQSLCPCSQPRMR